MGSSHSARPHPDHRPDRPASTATDRDRLRRFLVDRLTEELGALWARGRPGLASQVGILDDLLRGLAADRLPPRGELRVLLLGYGEHADYDPGWVSLV